MNPRWPKILPLETLEKLSSQRLLKVLDSARAAERCILHTYGPRCCELCHEYIGDDWENDVLKYSRPLTKYKELIKSILQRPEHKSFDKRLKRGKKR